MTLSAYSNDLDGMFESPHDAPPKWLCVLSQHMYTAYLDETGLHANDWIFVAGFLGKKEQWDHLPARWKLGLGQRKNFTCINFGGETPPRKGYSPDLTLSQKAADFDLLWVELNIAIIRIS